VRVNKMKRKLPERAGKLSHLPLTPPIQGGELEEGDSRQEKDPSPGDEVAGLELQRPMACKGEPLGAYVARGRPLRP